MNYKQKYLKYKTKYLELCSQLDNNEMIGGNNKIIIHITGPSGVGKTTIGNKLKEKFKNKIIVKDIDDLRNEFMNEQYGMKKFNWKSFDSNKYQKYINDFISKQTKPIVFVGLNHMFWHNKKLYYNMHSQYNFYIDINDMVIIKQKCIRFLSDELQDIIKNKNVIEDITKNNKKFLKLIIENIDRECGTKHTVKLNNMWKKDYKKQGYKFASRENIIKEVSKIIENI